MNKHSSNNIESSGATSLAALAGLTALQTLDLR